MAASSSALKRKDTSKEVNPSPTERLRRWICKNVQNAAVHAVLCARLDESFKYAVLGSLYTHIIWHDWNSQSDPVETVKQQTGLLLDYGVILRDRPANCDWKRIRSALLLLCGDGSTSRLISGNTSCEVNLDPKEVQKLHAQCVSSPLRPPPPLPFFFFCMI